MDDFLPSEVARLVLGYLKEVNCMNSWETFLQENPSLQEYYYLYKNGRVYCTNVDEKSLLEILSFYRILKKYGDKIVSEILRCEKDYNANPDKRQEIIDEITSIVSLTFQKYFPLSVGTSVNMPVFDMTTDTSFFETQGSIFDNSKCKLASGYTSQVDNTETDTVSEATENTGQMPHIYEVYSLSDANSDGLSSYNTNDFDIPRVESDGRSSKTLFVDSSKNKCMGKLQISNVEVGDSNLKDHCSPINDESQACCVTSEELSLHNNEPVKVDVLDKSNSDLISTNYVNGKVNITSSGLSQTDVLENDKLTEPVLSNNSNIESCSEMTRDLNSGNHLTQNFKNNESLSDSPPQNSPSSLDAAINGSNNLDCVSSCNNQNTASEVSNFESSPLTDGTNLLTATNSYQLPTISTVPTYILTGNVLMPNTFPYNYIISTPLSEKPLPLSRISHSNVQNTNISTIEASKSDECILTPQNSISQYVSVLPQAQHCNHTVSEQSTPNPSISLSGSSLTLPDEPPYSQNSTEKNMMSTPNLTLGHGLTIPNVQLDNKNNNIDGDECQNKNESSFKKSNKKKKREPQNKKGQKRKSNESSSTVLNKSRCSKRTTSTRLLNFDETVPTISQSDESRSSVLNKSYCSKRTCSESSSNIVETVPAISQPAASALQLLSLITGRNEDNDSPIPPTENKIKSKSQMVKKENVMDMSDENVTLSCYKNKILKERDALQNNVKSNEPRKEKEEGNSERSIISGNDEFQEILNFLSSHQDAETVNKNNGNSEVKLWKDNELKQECCENESSICNDVYTDYKLQNKAYVVLTKLSEHDIYGSKNFISFSPECVKDQFSNSQIDSQKYKKIKPKSLENESHNNPQTHELDINDQNSNRKIKSQKNSKVKSMSHEYKDKNNNSSKVKSQKSKKSKHESHENESFISHEIDVINQNSGSHVESLKKSTLKPKLSVNESFTCQQTHEINKSNDQNISKKVKSQMNKKLKFKLQGKESCSDLQTHEVDVKDQNINNKVKSVKNNKLKPKSVKNEFFRYHQACEVDTKDQTSDGKVESQKNNKIKSKTLKNASLTNSQTHEVDINDRNTNNNNAKSNKLKDYSFSSHQVLELDKENDSKNRKVKSRQSKKLKLESFENESFIDYHRNGIAKDENKSSKIKSQENAMVVVYGKNKNELNQKEAIQNCNKGNNLEKLSNKNNVHQQKKRSSITKTEAHQRNIKHQKETSASSLSDNEVLPSLISCTILKTDSQESKYEKSENAPNSNKRLPSKISLADIIEQTIGHMYSNNRNVKNSSSEKIVSVKQSKSYVENKEKYLKTFNKYEKLKFYRMLRSTNNSQEKFDKQRPISNLSLDLRTMPSTVEQHSEILNYAEKNCNLDETGNPEIVVTYSSFESPSSDQASTRSANLNISTDLIVLDGNSSSSDEFNSKVSPSTQTEGLIAQIKSSCNKPLVHNFEQNSCNENNSSSNEVNSRGLPSVTQIKCVARNLEQNSNENASSSNEVISEVLLPSTQTKPVVQTLEQNIVMLNCNVTDSTSNEVNSEGLPFSSQTKSIIPNLKQNIVINCNENVNSSKEVSSEVLPSATQTEPVVQNLEQDGMSNCNENDSSSNEVNSEVFPSLIQTKPVVQNLEQDVVMSNCNENDSSSNEVNSEVLPSSIRTKPVEQNIVMSNCNENDNLDDEVSSEVLNSLTHAKDLASRTKPILQNLESSTLMLNCTVNDSSSNGRNSKVLSLTETEDLVVQTKPVLQNLEQNTLLLNCIENDSSSNEFNSDVFYSSAQTEDLVVQSEPVVQNLVQNTLMLKSNDNNNKFGSLSPVVIAEKENNSLLKTFTTEIISTCSSPNVLFNDIGSSEKIKHPKASRTIKMNNNLSSSRLITFPLYSSNLCTKIPDMWHFSKDVSNGINRSVNQKFTRRKRKLEDSCDISSKLEFNSKIILFSDCNSLKRVKKENYGVPSFSSDLNLPKYVDRNTEFGNNFVQFSSHNFSSRIEKQNGVLHLHSSLSKYLYKSNKKCITVQKNCNKQYFLPHNALNKEIVQSNILRNSIYIDSELQNNSCLMQSKLEESKINSFSHNSNYNIEEKIAGCANDFEQTTKTISSNVLSSSYSLNMPAHSCNSICESGVKDTGETKMEISGEIALPFICCENQLVISQSSSACYSLNTTCSVEMVCDNKVPVHNFNICDNSVKDTIKTNMEMSSEKESEVSPGFASCEKQLATSELSNILHFTNNVSSVDTVCDNKVLKEKFNFCDNSIKGTVDTKMIMYDEINSEVSLAFTPCEKQLVTSEPNNFSDLAKNVDSVDTVCDNKVPVHNFRICDNSVKDTIKTNMEMSGKKESVVSPGFAPCEKQLDTSELSNISHFTNNVSSVDTVCDNEMPVHNSDICDNNVEDTVETNMERSSEKEKGIAQAFTSCEKQLAVPKSSNTNHSPKNVCSTDMMCDNESTSSEKTISKNCTDESKSHRKVPPKWDIIQSAIDKYGYDKILDKINEYLNA